MHLGASLEIQEGEERRKISLLGLDELSNLLLLDVCGDVDDAQLVWAVPDKTGHANKRCKGALVDE